MPPSSNAGPFVRRQRRESLLGGKPRRADLRAVFTGFEEGWLRSLYDGRAELRVRCPNSALRYAIYRRWLPALLNTATCSNAAGALEHCHLQHQHPRDAAATRFGRNQLATAAPKVTAPLLSVILPLSAPFLYDSISSYTGENLFTPTQIRTGPRTRAASRRGGVDGQVTVPAKRCRG